VALDLENTLVHRALCFLDVDIPNAFGTPAKLATLVRLIGFLPPLFVRPVDAGLVASVVHLLFGISESTPVVDVALATEQTSLISLRTQVSPRLYAALMEGLIVLHPLGTPVPAISAACSLQYDHEQFARSRAEMALYELLERRPRTRGLFRLNRKVSSAVGSPGLEVDLLCETLKLAVEIDGYHHFRDAMAYRRDRRKDVQLQELGYRVVRVLASDVHEEVEHVLEIVDGAVERLRSKS
jgi:very-short-patch-repair endonuclease